MSTLKIHPNDKLDACTIVARAWAGSRAHLALRYENSHQRNFRHLYDRLMAVDDDGPEPEEGTRERNEPNEPGVPASGGDTTNEQTASNQPVPEENAFLRNEANAELIPTHEGSTETTPAPPPSQAHPGRHPEPGNSIT